MEIEDDTLQFKGTKYVHFDQLANSEHFLFSVYCDYGCCDCGYYMRWRPQAYVGCSENNTN